MSVLNWLLPERVGEKKVSRGAHPIGGEYVIDVDSYLGYVKHSHRTTDDGVCEGCLSNSKELTQRLIDKVTENYKDIRIVFSGKSGFHIHVLDFELRDWANYSEYGPLKSHEVARFIYTKHLCDSVPNAFDKAHFAVSSDVLRVITFPESLNTETGLTCSYLGNPADFSQLDIKEIIEGASKSKGVVQWVNFTPASKMRPSRLELLKGGVVIQSQILFGGVEARR